MEILTRDHMKIFYTFFTLLCLSLTALSADCIENYPACWKGLYLNGQIGGSWDKQVAKFNDANFFNTLGPTIVGSTFNLKSAGVTGGAAIGYNAQKGCCVLGVESGILGTHLRKTEPSPFFPTIDTFSYRIHWIAFTRARAGYAFNRFLPYITGGWAGTFLDMRFEDSFNDIKGSSRKWGNGFTFGAGCEYQLTCRTYIGLAYDFFRIWHRTERSGCPHCGVGVGFGTPHFQSNSFTHALTLRCGIRL